jgi:hypothetical protein
MKKIFLPIIIILVSLIDLLYWFYYWNNYESLATTNFILFKEQYKESFPDFLKWLYATNPSVIDVVMPFLLIYSAVVLWKLNRTVLKIIAVIALVFAMRHLFSMM